MPVMDGFALIHELRATLRFANLPVIFTSGKDENRIPILAAGATEFLLKTHYTLDDLAIKVREYAGRGVADAGSLSALPGGPLQAQRPS